MAESKKITQLDPIPSLSEDDEFVVIDKSQKTGDDSSTTGKTSKATIKQLRDGMFPDGVLKVKRDHRDWGIQGIKGEKGSTGTDGDTYFSENGSDIYYNAGSIGIGTSNPQSKLQISQPSTTIGGNDITNGAMLVGEENLGIGIDNNEIIHTGQMLAIGTYINDSQSIDDNSGAIRFNPNKVEAMRILRGGNVGIGTTSPHRNLTVAGNFRLEKRGVDGGHTTLDFNSGGGADEYELNIYDKDGNAGVFTLKDSNVGIGTDSLRVIYTFIVKQM